MKTTQEKTLHEVYATWIQASGDKIAGWWPASWEEDNNYTFYIPTGKKGNHSEEQMVFSFTREETSPHATLGYEYRTLNRVVEDTDGTLCRVHHGLETDGSLEMLPDTSEDAPPLSEPLA